MYLCILEIEVNKVNKNYASTSIWCAFFVERRVTDAIYCCSKLVG